MSGEGKTSAAAGRGAASVPKRRFPEFQDAGAWESVTLRSVASVSTKKVGDKTCVPMSINSGIGLVSQMEKFGRIIAGDSYRNYLLLQKNEFAYNKSATKEFPEGFIALYTGEELAAVPNSIFTCFRVNEDAISPSYLNYLFLGNLHGRWLRRFIEVGARAHGSLSINDRDLLALPVPVPAGPNSLAEQQKIADFLNSADDLIAAQVQKVEALKAHKKGLMQWLFPQAGETEPRLRFPEFADTGAWQYVELGHLLKASPDYGVSAAAVPYDEDLPKYLRITDIAEGGRYLEEAKVSVDITPTRRDYLYEGDIAIARTGASVGKSYRYRREDGQLVFAGFLIRVRPDQRKLLTGYLAHYMATPQYWKWISVNSARSGQPGINSTELSSLPVPLPADDRSLREQQRIADCLSSLDELIAAETQKLDRLKTHKTGLIQQLFPQVAKDDK